jgi:dipeptidyl aminopeptidase/acylaminoacyl peptidase
MRVDAYGGTARRDLSVPQPGWAPRVAANGWLVTSDARSVTRILEVDLKTGQSAPVIRSSREDAAPALSPDGRRIAFASDRSGSRQIWVGESDGSGARQVTHLEGVTAFTPRWAPDGRRIAFEGRRGPASRIYLVSPDAGTAVALETGGSLHRLPSWSRDGRRVYFGSDRSGRFEVWKTRVGDAGQALETTQVTRSGGVAGFESADGKYFYYSKGETMTSIWQVPVAGGQEKPVLEEFAFNRYAANLAASRSGLYFPGRAQKDGCPIWELPFSPGKPREVYRMHGWLSPLGIAVSEDDRRLLVTVFTHQSGDILAYQAFR